MSIHIRLEKYKGEWQHNDIKPASETISHQTDENLP